MAKLKLYNSLTNKLEDFEPAEAGQARIYNCGPTVYKRQHLGNMRRMLLADVLRRTLEMLGYKVTDITNITDVGHLTEDDIDQGEDKMDQAAREQSLDPKQIADEQIQLFQKDLAALNIIPADKYPRASEHIEQMQEIITKLLENKKAYETDSGVYYDVTTFPDYGKLSGNTLDKVEAGKRVEVRADKKHPADFALWVKDDQHLQKWDSPWGVGYPGWHIECSAMAREYLGENIDIHTGGEDNRFPHHENEIAQSEGAYGGTFVKYWLHNRHLNLAGAKLAKSGGEQLTLDSLKEKGYSPLAFRLLVLGSHYRSPIEFSWESMDEATENLETIKNLLRRLPPPLAPPQAGGETVRQFAEAIADDLNTPKAMAVFYDYLKSANAKLDKGESDGIWPTLLEMDKVIGVVERLKDELESEDIPAEVAKLVDQREEARKSDNFEEADRLRGEIEKLGFSVEDTSSGARVVKFSKK